jgi:outer membrane protein assembly factor BamA
MQVNTYGIGFGMGIPINQYNSIDLGFNFSTRGKTDPGFVKDNYFKISAGLNFGELWFLKRVED